ncbi:MAG TPA: redox-sensitive transcriptional activator SoxR [Acidimicrobiales bacterium]
MDELLPIGAVAERAGTSVSALRFYEDRGLISSVRSGGGRRQYPRSVLRRLAFIQVAQRVGLSLDDIGRALATIPSDAPTAGDWRRLSAGWRPLIEERIRLLEGLRDSLEGCIGCGCLSLQHCKLRNPGDEAAARGPGARYLMHGDPSYSRS